MNKNLRPFCKKWHVLRKNERQLNIKKGELIQKFLNLFRILCRVKEDLDNYILVVTYCYFQFTYIVAI